MIAPQIYVMPIKKLMALSAFPDRSVAILNSADPVDTSHLPIPHHVAYYQDLDYESPRSFSPSLAEQLAGFVKTHQGHTAHIYVCCQAAQSRSPGIAAALYTYFGKDAMEIFSNPQYQPNMLCYRLLTDALGVSVSDEEADGLIDANIRAFRNAIRGGRN